MRSLIAVLAAAAVTSFAFTAEAAAPKKKQRYVAGKERLQPERVRERSYPEYGYDAMPDHFPTGSSAWWRAMEREGRGGFGNLP